MSDENVPVYFPLTMTTIDLLLVLLDCHILAPDAKLCSVLLVVAYVDEERNHALVSSDNIDHSVCREVHAFDDQAATVPYSFLHHRLNCLHHALRLF